MSMEYVRKTYGVPAKRGMRVELYYRWRGEWRLAGRGKITSASQYIYIDGIAYHPRDGVVYLDDSGNVLCDTRLWLDVVR